MNFGISKVPKFTLEMKKIELDDIKLQIPEASNRFI